MPTISGSVLFDKPRAANGSGTAIPNVPVVLRNTTTGVGLVVLTSATGVYSFTNVPAGTYTLVEAWGTVGGVATPANFATAVVIPAATPKDPPVSQVTAPPAGTNVIDSVTPNTINLTVAAANITGQYFADSPRQDIPFVINDVTLSGSNILTDVQDGMWGTLPAGSPINSRPAVAPYPTAVPDFTYTTGVVVGGQYTVDNITKGLNTSWWNFANHTTGDETSRLEVVNGAPIGSRYFVETVNVLPNTTYLFSAWFVNMIKLNGWPSGPGVLIKTPSNQVLFQVANNQIIASASILKWYEIGAFFNTGNNTSLTVAFYDVNGGVSGNDYAVDDFSLVQAQVNDVLAPIIKSVDKTLAQPGDTLTYTATFTNTGVSTAQNIHFVDTIPAGTTFVSNSVTVNGVTVAGSPVPPLGMTIPNMIAGKTTSVTFKVIVNSVPTTNPIPNSAVVNYAIAPVVGSTATIPVSTLSNTVNTKIDALSIGPMTKSVDLVNAEVGDTLTYTLSFTNTGTQTATNVIFSDTIPNGTLFVTDSLTINGATQVGADPTPPGTSIPDVPVDALTTITFQVVITSIPNPNPIANQALLTYQSLTVSTPQNNASNVINTKVNTSSVKSTKTADLSFANIGDTVAYTIVIKNSGADTAMNLVVIDTTPNGTIFVTDSLVVNTTPVLGTDLNPPGYTLPDLEPGGVDTITFSVVVDTVPNPNPIVNSANYSYTILGTTEANNSTPAKTQVNHAALLPAVKAVDKLFGDVGDTITYTISFTNTGNMTADNVVITDTVPNDTTYIVGSVTSNVAFTGDPLTTIDLTDSVGVGQTVTITFSVSIDTIPVPNPIPNAANIAYNYMVDPSVLPTNDASNTNTVDTQVNHAELSPASKTSDKTVSFVGDTITYTIVFSNTGSTTADNVVIIDTVPNGTVYIGGSTSANVAITGDPTTQINLTNPVGVGQTVTVTFQVAVNTMPNPNPIINRASISYNYLVDPSLPPTNGGANTNGAPTQVNQAQLLPATKVADKGYANIGDTITYTIVFANTGNTSANNVVITDTVPNGTTYVGGSINSNVPFTGDPTNTINLTSPVGAGQTVTMTFQVVITTTPNPNPIVNTASMAYNYITDPSLPPVNGGSNTNGAPTQVNKAQLSPSTKTVDKGYATIGDTITYTIVFANSGNTSANNVVITDTIPNGTSYIGGSIVGNVSFTGDPTSTINLTNSVGAGQTVTLTFSVTVITTPNPNPIVNTASMSYNYIADPSLPPINGGSNTNGAPTQINNADLGPVTKLADKVSSNVGDTITYTIAFTNTGNTTANNVVIVDTVPNGTTYVGGSLNANVPVTGDPTTTISLTNPVGSGQTVTVTFQVVVNTLPNPNPIVNIASIGYNYIVDPSLPPVPSSNTSNRVPTPINQADLGPATKVVDKATSSVGDTLTYTIVFTNTGNTTANNVIITDTIPNGTTYVGGSLNANVPVIGDPTTTIDLTSPVAVGQTVTITFQVVVSTIPNPNPIVNTASIAYNYIGDPSLPPVLASNHTNGASTRINKADLGPANKAADKNYANIGDTITYTINFTNTGNTTANNVVLTDTVPNGTTYVGGSLSANVPVTGDPTTTIHVTNPIGVGQTVTLTFQVVVTTFPNPNPIVNTANIAYNYIGDPSLPPVPGSNDTDGADTSVKRANLGPATKAADKTYARLGDNITYTIVFTNTGNIPADHVVIVDTIPGETSYVAGSLSANVPFTGDPTTAIHLINSVSVGETVTLTFKVNVYLAPVTNPITNTASIDYDYIVDPSLPAVPASTNTNGADTMIKRADLGPAGKVADKDFANIGDTITYEIVFTNRGNTTANNVVITDTVPNGSAYVVGSISANVPITGTPTTTMQLTNPVGVGQTVTVTFKVVVMTIPVPNPMTNIASIAYNYINDPSLPPVPAGANTNGADTKVNHANLGPAIKGVDKSAADLGDTLTYTIAFTNTGSTTANNVVIVDTVPSGTLYVGGSLTSSVPVTGDPTTTIQLTGGVGVGQTVTLTFKVVVMTMTLPNPNPIVNIANIAYNYSVDPSLPPVPASTDTNGANTDVKHADLGPAAKSVDKANTKIGDTLTYTVVFSNTGNTTAINVVIVDTLPSVTSYVADSLTSSVPVTGDPTTNIHLTNPVGAGQTVTVSFKVVITSVPNPNTITNIASINYDYVVDPSLPPRHGTNDTNGAPSIVLNPEFTVTKVASIPEVIVGTPFVYTVKVTNSGNVVLNNVVFTDPLPVGFTVMQIKLDGGVIGGDLVAGIPLGTLAVGQSHTFEITVVVDSTVVLTNFNNVAKANGTAPLNPDQPEVPIEGKGTDTRGITIYNPLLQVVKSADKAYAIEGDTVTYSIKVINKGNVAIDNVVVSDNLSNELGFVAGSVTIDGVPVPSANILVGINVGTVGVGQTKTVTFETKVISSTITPIVNTADTRYSYTIPGMPPVKKETQSNPYTLGVTKAELIIDKKADKKCVMLGDTLTYTVKITNTGKITAQNVIFKDYLTSQVKFVPGSFTVNGVVMSGVELDKGVLIGDIPVGTTVIIKYQVIVVGDNCKCYIINDAKAVFRYTLPNGYIGHKESSGGSEHTNMTKTQVAMTTFKQLSVDGYFQIPSPKPDMEDINRVSVTIEIEDSNVIKTSKGTSREGQNLTGRKLIIHGKLNIVVEYTALNLEQSVHSAHYCMPFSTFIVLSPEECTCNHFKPGAIVEDVFSKMINERYFFVNTTMLINTRG